MTHRPTFVAALAFAAYAVSAETSAPAPGHHWLFAKRCVEGETLKALNGPKGSILGDTYIAGGKGPHALVLDGKDDSVMITTKSSQAGLPEENLAVEAWVMVEKPLTWGGIIGAVRDNGTDETGWVLGFRDRKFTFAIATVDKPRLTYLPSKTSFEAGRWYHVVGTYDGQEHRVYVNGQLEATDKSRKGKLLYPPTDTFYEIGAYHDTNEYFRLTGLIHEVAVYKQTLTADQVAARHEAKRGKFPEKQFRPEPYRPPMGPYAYYDSPQSAVICWETDSPCPTVLEIGTDGTLDRRVGDPKPKTVHRVTVDGLKRNTKYAYRVAGGDETGGSWPPRQSSRRAAMRSASGGRAWDASGSTTHRAAPAPATSRVASGAASTRSRAAIMPGG